MPRLPEQRQQVGVLHQMPGVHHAHPIRHISHHAHIVRNQQDGRPGIPAQPFQPLQNLRLQRNIHAGSYLVRNQQTRAHHHRHRQHYPLALPPAQSERICPHNPARIRHPQLPQHLLAHPARRPPAQLRVRNDYFGQLRPDGLHRIQRGLRVLKYQRHRLAAPLPPLLLRCRRQVNPVKHDAPARDGAVVRQQPHHRQRQRALAGAALPHHAEDLLLPLLKRHAVDGLHRPVGSAVLYPQVFNLQQSGHTDLMP